MMLKITEKKTEFPLRAIYFYPTESCNLRCIHCWIHPPYAPDRLSYNNQNKNNLTVKDMEVVVKDALPLGLSFVKITGGEPFLASNLFDFLDLFSDNNLSLAFETNGTLLNKEITGKLAGYNVTQMSVSLDGSTPALHEKIRGVKGCFDKALSGIRLLVENGMPPQVIYCLQKVNAYDLESTIRLVRDMGVLFFEINPVTILGSRKTTECKGLPVEELISLEKRVETEFLEKYPDMRIDLYLPPALKSIKLLSSYPLCACRIHNICGLLSNGDVSICGIGRCREDLIMGNVRNESMAMIWEEGLIFREIRKNIPFEMKGICGKCLFKSHCLGFCRSDVLFNGQAIDTQYSLCEEVYKKGLFPKSRILKKSELSAVKRINPL